MKITLNGAPVRLATPTSVADLLGGDPRGRAVAVNGSVVPRERHAVTELADGDEVEIVTAVQGG
jgi:sulfur carrier protein